MKIDLKVSLLASAVCASAILVVMEQMDNNDPSYLPVTEHVPTPSAAPDANSKQHKVAGLRGDYPKYLTTDDVLEGEVEMPQVELDPGDAYDAKAEAWAKVDLELIRSLDPDSLYWTMAAPTQDQAILDMREEKRQELERIESKMMARHATEQEIRDYFAYQQQLSEDYVVVITEILDRYGEVFSEEDFGGQTLARTMHLSKLQEIPNKIARAIEQRQDFLEEKEEWMADKAAYQAKLEAEAAAANRALGKI